MGKNQVEKTLYVPIINPEGIIPPNNSFQWNKQILLSIFSNNKIDKISSQSYKFLKKLKSNCYQKIVTLNMTPSNMVPIIFSFLIVFKNKEKKSFLDKIAEDFDKIIPLKSKYCSIENLTLRTGTPYSFKDKNVLLIGAGSVGSFLSLHLSKIGITKLTISDPKEFNYETVLRNYIGAGRLFSEGNKSKTLKDKIELDSPWLHVDAWDWNILFKNRDQQKRSLSNFDLIIVATGGSDIQLQFNALFHDIEIKCPVIFNWLDSEGKGQHALIMKCDKCGCFECLFSENEKKLGRNKISFADGTEKIHNTCCNGSFTKYGTDVLNRNTAMMMPLIQETLINGIEENYIVSVRNDFSSLETRLTMKPILRKSFEEKGCNICNEIQKNR